MKLWLLILHFLENVSIDYALATRFCEELRCKLLGEYSVDSLLSPKQFRLNDSSFPDGVESL